MIDHSGDLLRSNILVPDAVEHQVGDAGAGVRHGDPDDVIKLTVERAHQGTAPARGGEYEIPAVVSLVLDIRMVMSGEDCMLPAAKQDLDLRPARVL